MHLELDVIPLIFYSVFNLFSCKYIIFMCIYKYVYILLCFQLCSKIQTFIFLTCLFIGLQSACWSKLKALAMPTPKCSWLGSTSRLRSKSVSRASDVNSGDTWMWIVCRVLHFQLPGTNQTCVFFQKCFDKMTRPGTYQVLARYFRITVIILMAMCQTVLSERCCGTNLSRWRQFSTGVI